MIYVNCDASYHNGWAGLAYQSDRLESQTRLVGCKNKQRGRATRHPADDEQPNKPVIFRTDRESAATARGASEHLRPWRAEACLYLAAHRPGWSIRQISRAENVLAHALVPVLIS